MRKGWIVAFGRWKRYTGRPVTSGRVSAGRTPAVNATAVESAQNGFVGKERGETRARRSDLRANDGQNGARCAPFYIVRQIIYRCGILCCQTLVRARASSSQQPERQNALHLRVTQLLSFSAQRLCCIGRQLIDFSVAGTTCQ